MKVKVVDPHSFTIHCDNKKFLVKTENFMLYHYTLDLFLYDIMKKYLWGKFYFINGFSGLDIREIKEGASK